MTIEQMIEALENTAELSYYKHVFTHNEAIIAALRAGQALALEAEVAERAFCRLHMDVHGTEAVPPHFAGVSKARRAWDAATKGDEG